MNNKSKIAVMIVWAMDIDNKSNNCLNLPWIYGAYTDQSEGFKIQEKMQSSKEYNHLYWDNNIILLDKEF